MNIKNIVSLTTLLALALMGYVVISAEASQEESWCVDNGGSITGNYNAGEVEGYVCSLPCGTDTSQLFPPSDLNIQFALVCSSSSADSEASAETDTF